MVQYIKEIIIPYVQRQREILEDDKPAVVIIDNYSKILEENDNHVCLLPANTTDVLQPMDVSVNKSAKDFLRNKFQEWYTSKVMDQLQGRDPVTTELEPISLGLPELRELGAKWLVQMAEYISANPHIVVNGFI